MRKICWTIACLWLSVLVSAQDNTVWHNQGAVSSTGNGQATMNIGGDIKFSNRASSTKPEMSIGNSRIKLTGNFINNVDRGNLGGTLLVPLFGGIFEFCGTAPQFIKTIDANTPGAVLSDFPSKLTNFINFPQLVINNNKHVTLSAQLAAQTQDIDLEKGWLILDSEKAKAGVDGDLVGVDEANESVLAHLLVNGNVNYNMPSWYVGQDPNDRGFVQVNLKLENEGHLVEKSIVGFGSPFKEIYSDYFIFNTLLEPVPAGFLTNPPIDNPKRALEAGRGYVAGIDLRGGNISDYLMHPDYKDQLSFDKRSKDGYMFNRSLFHHNRTENQMFGDDVTLAAYRNEVLNNEDITIPLEAGYNYLSNPFTCPLNIDKLLGSDEAGDTWKVRCDDWGNNPEVRNRVWILNTNSRAKKNAGDNTTNFLYNYQVAMRTGGTYESDDQVPGVTTIAPLQMFLVYAHSSAGSITIPKKERTMATTRFLRNTSTDNKRKDDFILEFRNQDTQTTDRVSFVLRSAQELENSTGYDNVNRMVTNTGSNEENALEYDGIVQGYASQVYTKDGQNIPLSVQFLPLETTEYIQIYHIAPLETQNLQVLGRRIDTKDQVDILWLEDRLYNTMVEITPDLIYETVSKPNDPVDRFIVRLKMPTSLDNENLSQNIYAYTQGNNIVVQGFSQHNYGKKVELYDLNGRLLANEIVASPSLVLFRDYQPGVYFIKVDTPEPTIVKLIAH